MGDGFWLSNTGHAYRVAKSPNHGFGACPDLSGRGYSQTFGLGLYLCDSTAWLGEQW